MGEVSYKGHRYPAEIIARTACGLYHRFPLSFREVEELMVIRGVIVTYETIRQWCAKFGPVYAAGLRRRQPRPGDKWHLDEVFLTINGRRQYLWRAVDQDGNVLDILVQPRRDAKSAKRFFRKLLKKQRARNVLAKVPKNAQAQVKADYWAIFDVPDTIEPGLDAVGYVQKRIDSFDKRWRDAYPAAVRCLLDDRDSLTVYLRFPREHWTRVRHSNFIVVWSPPGSVFDVRHAALRCLVVRGGRGYLQSSRRQSLRGNDAGCTGHLTGLVA